METFHAKHGVIKLPPTDGLSNKQRSWLNLAKQLAEVSEVNHKHGAVVVKSGRPVSLGVNKWRNRDMLQSPDGYNPNLTVHAEMDALSRVTDPKGAVVYIARVGKNGDERFSRPCNNCAKALAEAGVKAVVYTV